MINKSLSRILGLFLIPALILSACGWLPFTAPVTISTTPDGAEVYKEGGAELLGTTPFKTHIFLFKKNLEIKKEKFYTEKITLTSQTMEKIQVALRPTPVLVYTKIDAEIYEADATNPFGKTPINVEVNSAPRTCILKRVDYFDKEITIGLETKTPIVTQLKRRPIVTLTTAPAGVGIYENDKLLATSTLREEISVPRTFELRKKDYYSKTLNLTPTSDPEMDVTLEPLPIITIQTDPADATVYLVGDSKPLGTAPLTLTIKQATGFEARADRHYSKTITVQPKTQTASIELQAMPYVTISSNPSGAAVTLGGKAIGTTPVEQLIEKPTTAELALEGYQTQTVTLSGKETTPVIKLEKMIFVEDPAVVKPVAQPEPKKKGFFQKLRKK